VSTTKKTLLLVDDDVDVLEQVSAALGCDGYELLTAETSVAAEEILLSRQPDLAVLDLMLEEADAGFVLCHRLKKLYPGTPVIILSAVAASAGLDFTPQSAEERSWVKAELVMAKPFIPERLRHEVRRLLAATAKAAAIPAA
jgi:CheY-like chemotaxis protein